MDKEKNQEVKSFDLQAELGSQLIVDVLLKHRDIYRQASSGIVPEWNLDLNNRVMISGKDYDFPIYSKAIHQEKALQLLISNQLELICLIRPILKLSKSKNHKEIMKISKHLKLFRSCIFKATQTKRLEDDFIKVFIDNHGTNNRVELTQNFYDMMEELEDTYEKIYEIIGEDEIISHLIKNASKKLKTNEIY